MKSRGPRTEPWGTRYTEAGHVRGRQLIIALDQFRTVPLIPNEGDRRDSAQYKTISE